MHQIRRNPSTKTFSTHILIISILSVQWNLLNNEKFSEFGFHKNRRKDVVNDPKSQLNLHIPESSQNRIFTLFVYWQTREGRTQGRNACIRRPDPCTLHFFIGVKFRTSHASFQNAFQMSSSFIFNFRFCSLIKRKSSKIVKLPSSCLMGFQIWLKARFRLPFLFFQKFSNASKGTKRQVC